MVSKTYKECLVGLGITITFIGILVSSYISRYLGLERDPAVLHLTAVFNRVDGVSVGSPIYLSGIPIGEVAALALLPDFRARMTLAIDRAAKLPTDTSVAIQTDGLLGEKFIRVSPGGNEELLGNNSMVEYTQDAVVVRELMDLIIAEARQARTHAPRVDQE